MAINLTSDPVPLHEDEHGVLRVSGTRVTLLTVLTAYLEGASAEEIVGSYPTLPLSAVHGVIAYYLNHRAEMDSYLVEDEARAEEVRREVRTWPGHAEMRERLIARRDVRRVAERSVDRDAT